MKYVILANNRATVGRMKALCDEMRNRYMDVDVILGCSAWDSEEFVTPYRIQSMYAGDDQENMVLTTASYMTQLVSHLRMLNPDYAIIHGDRYEQLGAAICCSYMNIPIIHTEGGDLSGSIDNQVRWAITALASLHFPISKDSEDRLRMHETPNVFNVGSTGIDLLRKWMYEWTELKTTMHGRPEPYVLVVYHPDTRIKEDIKEVIKGVLDACGGYRIKWVNANVDAGSRKMMKEVHKYDVDFIKNVPPEEYFELMFNASLLIGNSSSFVKEAAFMGRRVVLIGNRQHWRETADNILWTPVWHEQIEKMIRYGLENPECEPDMRFGDGHACERICETLEAL